MKSLNESEKNLIEHLLGDQFHKMHPIHEDEKTKCWEVISIAKKLELRNEFINELESAYNFEFNKWL